MRDVYLISDLHLGGAQPLTGDPDDRGFRICTHGRDIARFVSALADKPSAIELIINGDMVDFLAEEDEGGGWTPFVSDEHAAARKLDRIIDRDRELFDAFSRLLERGHRLVLLLGNHDIELALPAVRRRLQERIGITGRHDFQFIYDGEAYVVGRALIEHGNRYDSFNVVDYDGMRRLRSLLSRNQMIPANNRFDAPAGSHMVADVINPIKRDYRLIDLLKPETGAAIPVLMALEPGYRAILTRVAALGLKARKHRMAAPAVPSFAGDIRADSDGSWTPDGFASDISSSSAAPDALATILQETMKGDADLLLKAAPAKPSFVEDISTRDTIDRGFGFARLLASSSRDAVESRLPALLAAVRTLQNDTSFVRDAECFTEYLDAARDLASDGFDYVIFGHTHLARDIALSGGARYLNSGTWADLIRFPSEILHGSPQQAYDALRAFVEDMGNGRLHAWTSFIPTYVKLTIDEDGAVRHVSLSDYTSPDQL
jgi:UDP-2,3-diacylglucosamine pyrophosphatase LpxH